jgi:serine/threonine protein phosphatase 1
MATYVMSDIHGCYDEMQQMFEKIGFSDEDKLIIAGDIVDRGNKNREILDWMLDAPANVEFLMGNHDRDFVSDVETFLESASDEPNLKSAYQTAARTGFWGDFDHYKTIKNLLATPNIRVTDFLKWKKRIEKFPYVKELNINGRDFIIVHAGYPDEAQMERLKSLGGDNLEHFYVWAREKAVTMGGRPNTTIISGHTPTISTRDIFYNKGRVKKIVDETRDCVFYDIDCGCVFREDYKDGRLACMRLEDEKIFYV